MAEKYDKPIVDREKCIGAGPCVATAPDAFELDESNIAFVKDTWVDVADETLLQAAQACPVAAITIKEKESGKQVYP